MSLLLSLLWEPAQTFEQKKSAGSYHTPVRSSTNLSYPMGSLRCLTQVSVDMISREATDTAILLLLYNRFRGASSTGD